MHTLAPLSPRIIRVQKTPHFFLKKSPTKWVFGVLLGFLDKQEKIGKII